jgi:alkanesulfonate monooxygenase SsuD/methylene tetrahydromethanopterin reductase-like flavin-dependent oxidoreductase (luciferase family)
VRFDVQLNPATTPWPQLRDAARAVEDAGFDALWAWDHLSGASMRGSTMLDCFTLLGAYALVTERIGLGTLVANVVNRHPAVLAGAAASVDTISGGRFTLGLGAGASPTSPFAAEHRAVDIPLGRTLAERHQRFEACLDQLEALWAADRNPRYAGFPRPAHRVPLVVGVNSRPLARIAGRRADGINVRADHPDLAGLLAEAAQARAARRPPADAPPWSTSVWTWWSPELLQPASAALRPLADLGVERLVLVITEPPDLDAIARAGRDVAHLRT